MKDIELLTIDKIINWVKIFKEKYGEYPYVDEKRIIIEQGNFSWKILNKSLKRGYRSLPGGYSLSRLICDNFNEKPRTRQSKFKISESDIIYYMQKFKDIYGFIPNCGTKEEIPDCPGKTWSDIHTYLYAGKVIGLIGERSGLQQMASKHFGQINNSDFPNLTTEMIINWLKLFYDIYEYYPSAIDKKEVPDAPLCVTWTKIHKSLYHGLNGLPGGSSLAKIKEEYLGQVNKSNLPPWTEDKIALVMYQFNDLYGYYPKADEKFAVPGHPNDTWCGLSSALQQGKRGLGKENKGNSLTLVAEKYFGRRNQSNLSDLTEIQIVKLMSEFFNLNGYYPNSHDKLPIPNLPNETWLSLNYAIRHGARSLIHLKGSSLTKLAQKHFGYIPYSNYYNENLCRTIIERLTGYKFPSSYDLDLKWLINKNGQKLQLDGVNLDLKLAFEHQGEQHYLYNPTFHNKTELDFFKQIQKDALKLKLCNDNNITLICIYQNEPDKELFIKNELIKLGISIISE